VVTAAVRGCGGEAGQGGAERSGKRNSRPGSEEQVRANENVSSGDFLRDEDE